MALHFSLVWDHKDAEKASIDILKKLSSEDKSTLYSSFIYGKTWKETIFFGGTALGYVFLWSETKEMYRLDGHNVSFHPIAMTKHSIYVQLFLGSNIFHRL